MHKKIMSFLLGMVMLVTTFFMTGCGSSNTGGDDGGSEYFNISNYLTGYKVGSKAENMNLYDNIINDVTAKILGNLMLQYGDLAANYGYGINYTYGMEEDSHVNAFISDNWLWNDVFSNCELINRLGSINPKINKKIYNMSNTQSNYELYGFNTLKYQIYQVLLGRSITSIIPGSSDYFEMLNRGEFSLEKFQKKANSLNHTGFFYYEADLIAEFILNFIIGTDIVSYDNLKFVDVNNNGSFDYYEYNPSESFYSLAVMVRLWSENIINNFNNNEIRSEKTSRSEEWDRIVWGRYEDSYKIDDVVNLIEYILENGTIGEIDNEGYCIGTVVSDYRLPFFKNYTNVVYYCVYEGIGNCFPNRADINIVENDEEINYFDEDGIKPNIDTTFYDPNSLVVAFDTSGEEVDSFQIDADEYKSVVIMSKKNISITSCWMIFELDPSITEEVTLQINAKYKRCLTSNTHEHTLACDFQTIEANLGQVTLTPGIYDFYSGNELAFDLSPTQNQVAKLEELGFKGTLSNTEFATMGINAFNLTEFQTLTEESGMLDRFVAEESDALEGAKLGYKNDLSDFVEITFDVVSTHSTPVPFKFAFAFLGASSR